MGRRMAELSAWQKLAKRVRVPMGFVVAAAFLWIARPTLETLGSSLLLVVPGVSLRSYPPGYVRKNAELTVTGPYAYTRNPLYLGSLLITLGFGAAAGSWWLLALLAGVFALIYIPTIQGEERYLRAHFAEFEGYATRVPRLLPKVRAGSSKGGAGTFSRERYLHHREYNSVIGAGAIYLALGLKIYVVGVGVLR